ncbi:MAG: DUF2314 domain-containing protein [Actinomycetota bacterium]|nr:DUF2314 domain-containing protein [Actinomycetota bacterium]
MTAILDAALSWRALLLACLFFGFAPGLVLRFVTLAYPRDDPRRRELRAELFAVPRIERPLWVAEQIEVALCEGLWERVREVVFYYVFSNRLLWGSRLESGTEQNRLYPDTFWVPSSEEKSRIAVGTFVKVMFMDRGKRCERMWVEVTKMNGTCYEGTLSNLPIWVRGVRPEARVRFTGDHIINIDPDTILPDRCVWTG